MWRCKVPGRRSDVVLIVRSWEKNSRDEDGSRKTSRATSAEPCKSRAFAPKTWEEIVDCKMSFGVTEGSTDGL